MPTTLTSADLLRAAAETLREEAARAHRASPSPWTATDEHVVRCADGMTVADRSETDHPAERGDLPYIALMHPGVGLALADWLHAAAERLGDTEAPLAALLDPSALAVARQLLGTTEAAECGKTVGVSGLFYRPCARPAGHPEAYCRDASGDHMFLAAAPPAPADRAATRDRIADALAAADGWEWGPGHDSLTSSVIGRYLRRADAVLAALADDAAAGVQPPTTETDHPGRCPVMIPGVGRCEQNANHPAPHTPEPAAPAAPEEPA